MEKNKKIIFDLPENTILVDIIDKILKDNGLEENNKAFFNKSVGGIEPRLIIVRDAAITFVEKRISEEKLIELLQKHLETTKEITQKIMDDIKQKLVPYAKIIDLKKQVEIKKREQEIMKQEEEIKYQKEEYRKELLNRIQGGISQSKLELEENELLGVKKVEVKDVEENAKKIKEKREEAGKLGTVGEGLQHKGQTDRYREPIE